MDHAPESCMECPFGFELTMSGDYECLVDGEAFWTQTKRQCCPLWEVADA